MPTYVAATELGSLTERHTTKILINARGDILTKDNHGRTLLHVAVRYDSGDVFKTLFEADGDISGEGDDGRTPLHIAKQYDSADVLDRSGSICFRKRTNAIACCSAVR
jgi:ankyrin repeat protein